MNKNQYELYHYGVKGMKWGVRKKSRPNRAEKKRAKYANKADRMANVHESNARTYSKEAKRYHNMSDADYARMYDDAELLKMMGGAHNARLSEVKANELKSRDSISAAKKWSAARDEIMNAPIDRLKKRSDYQAIINRHLN